MTTTAPIAFTNAGLPLASDDDLLFYHPDMANNLWKGKDDYTEALETSFSKLLRDLAMAGWDSGKILATAANIKWFKAPIVYGAFIIIFRDFKGVQGDRWDMLQSDYQREYELAVKNAKLDYDDDTSGTITTVEEGSTKRTSFVR